MSRLPLALIGVLFFSAFGFAYSFEPQAAYPGMEVVLDLEGEGVSMVQVVGKVTEEKLLECGKVSCPVFESNETEFFPAERKTVKLLTAGTEPGNYLLKFSFRDETLQPVYSTLIVQADYRLFVAGISLLLLALLFWVERNEKRT